LIIPCSLFLLPVIYLLSTAIPPSANWHIS
jgi:hypothetical protein